MRMFDIVLLYITVYRPGNRCILARQNWFPHICFHPKYKRNAPSCHPIRYWVGYKRICPLRPVCRQGTHNGYLPTTWEIYSIRNDLYPYRTDNLFYNRYLPNIQHMCCYPFPPSPLGICIVCRSIRTAEHSTRHNNTVHHDKTRRLDNPYLFGIAILDRYCRQR